MVTGQAGQIRVLGLVFQEKIISSLHPFKTSLGEMCFIRGK